MSILIERETSAGSAGARRATRDPAGRDAAGVEDPEVREQAKRRRFSAEYKLRIVREADAFGKGDGDVAALLRREGLYSSQLSSWRRQRDEIAKVGMTSRKRGRKAKAEDPRVKELERENARLQRRLARVETMLEIQKKTSELLCPSGSRAWQVGCEAAGLQWWPVRAAPSERAVGREDQRRRCGGQASATVEVVVARGPAGHGHQRGAPAYQ